MEVTMEKKIMYVQTIFLTLLFSLSLFGNGKEPVKDNGIPEKKLPPGIHRNTRTGGHPGRFGARGRSGGMNRFAGRFTAEERSELHRLSMAGDRVGFGKKMRELRKKYATEEDKKVFLLEEKYHGSKTAEEKRAIRKELESAVKIQIQKRNDFTLKQINLAEEKLRKLKEFHARNVKNADKTALKMTEFLCTPPGERKNFYRNNYPLRKKPETVKQTEEQVKK